MASIACRTLLINSNIGSTTKSILSTLLNYCHNGKDECYPSIGDMMDQTSYVRRTIQVHLRILERLKIIAITKGTKRKSNTYKILGLYGVQTHGACGAPRSNSSEEVLKTIYDDDRSQDQKTKAKSRPAKTKKPSTPQRVAEAESQKPVEPQRVAKSQPATPQRVHETKTQPVAPQRVPESQHVAPQHVAEAENQKPVAPQHVAESQSATPQRVSESRTQPVAPQRVAESQSQKPIVQHAGKIRFKGVLTIELAVEIYKLYCKAGFVQKSTASLLEFLSACAAVSRLKRKNKCRDVYAYLTFIYKNRKTWAIIKDEDEDKARGILRQIREKGLVDL